MTILARLLLILICIGFAAKGLWAQSNSIGESWKAEEYRQFDFWIGKWDVNLRMIQPDLTWRDSVKAKVEIYPILDGKAILELWDSKPIKGFSLRYFDPQKKKWVLYLNWPSNSRSNIGSLEGTFRHGRGEFFSRSKTGTGTLISRYTFCDITDKSLRWDDAFSRDGGKTWTHNWIMEFSRTAEKTSWPDKDWAHTFVTGNRCKGKEFEMLNQLAGEWRGKTTIEKEGDPIEVESRLKFYKILDGCTVIRFLEYQYEGRMHRDFGLLTYNRGAQAFEELRMDNRPGTVASLMRGKNVDGELTLNSKSKRAGKEIFLRQRWSLPDKPGDSLVWRMLNSNEGKEWTTIRQGQFKKQNSNQAAAADRVSALKIENAINRVCPRSGKPIVASSLARYRGKTVGFCNQHCRDDFAANISERPKDRAFFDNLIDQK